MRWRCGFLGAVMGFATGPALADPEPPAQLLEMPGDSAYGEYLSSSCNACHSPTGENELPHIHGIDRDYLITAMHAYRIGARENPVMQNITKPLSDEELVSIAEWLSSVTE